MNTKQNKESGISRRKFLKGAAFVAGTGLIASCTPQVAATAAPTAAAANSSKGSEDWLGTEPVIGNVAETVESDVIVIGFGTGGAYAAASCLEKGLKVTILEKNKINSTVRNDFGSIGSKWQQAGNAKLDEASILHYHMMYCGNRIDSRLQKIWAAESGEAVTWFGELMEKRNCGKFDWEGGYEPDFGSTTFPKFPTGHSGIWNKDTSGAIMMNSYIKEMGGDFRFETTFVKFEHDGNKVTAAIAKDKDGKYIRFVGKKGIVLSTGGYQNNAAMLQALQSETLMSMGKPTPGANVGDGIKACLWMGAKMDECHASMLFDRGAMLPNETPATATKMTYFVLGSQPWLKVNLNGERFTNESIPYDFILHAAASQPANCYCAIFDSNYFKQIVQNQTVGCSRIFPFPNGSPNDTTGTDMKVIEETWKQNIAKFISDGFLQQADTPEELAKKLNIPADTFAATLKRYNELADKGTDDDFFKDSYRLMPLKAAPYYGIRLSGMMLTTLDGIKIDTQMRPLDQNNKPFEGLQVIGDSSGSYFAHTYPNLCTGYANGRTITYGRRVARILSGGPVDL